MPVSKAFEEAAARGDIQLSLKGHLFCLSYDLAEVRTDLKYLGKWFWKKISRLI